MGKLNDLSGKQFGKLIVLKRAPNSNNKVFWQCQCECGKIVNVRSDQLVRGITRSCGCYAKQIASLQGKQNFKDLTGQKFGKLTALYPIKKSEKNKYYWTCECDCGNTIEVIGTSLTSKNTQSCGCIKSIGEANIKLLLEKNNINFISQYSITINDKKYFYDFAIVDSSKNLIRLIEFDGIQHFGRISGWFTVDRKTNLQISDMIKNNYALNNNIPLVRIPYTERDNIALDMILGDQYLIT